MTNPTNESDRDRVTVKAQIAYQLLSRIQSACGDLLEAQPEVVERFASRLQVVLMLLDCMGRACYPGWRSHTWEMRRRGLVAPPRSESAWRDRDPELPPDRF